MQAGVNLTIVSGIQRLLGVEKFVARALKPTGRARDAVPRPGRLQRLGIPSRKITAAPERKCVRITKPHISGLTAGQAEARVYAADRAPTPPLPESKRSTLTHAIYRVAAED